jgi:hypothetical protein
MRCHIIHVAMKACIQPLLQLFMRAIEASVGNAQISKAELNAPLPDVARKTRRKRVWLIGFHEYLP